MFDLHLLYKTVQLMNFDRTIYTLLSNLCSTVVPLDLDIWPLDSFALSYCTPLTYLPSLQLARLFICRKWNMPSQS